MHNTSAMFGVSSGMYDRHMAYMRYIWSSGKASQVKCAEGTEGLSIGIKMHKL